MTDFLFIVFTVTCFLIVILVLLQNDEGDSLGTMFGGGSSSFFGAQSYSVLYKTVLALGFIFLFLSLFIDWWNKTPNDKAFIEQLKNKQAVEQTVTPNWWENNSSVHSGVSSKEPSHVGKTITSSKKVRSKQKISK